MSIVKPEYFTLNELLQFKFFEIPNYQRPYSWTTKQRQVLFDDIDRILSWKQKERHHFMSTIVCLNGNLGRKIGTDQYCKYYIVDGQQRLTTLIILLKAICKSLKGGTQKQKEEAARIQELLVKDDLRILLTNFDNRNLFRQYLSDGNYPKVSTALTFTDKNMINAFHECEAFVKKWKFSEGTLTLLEIVKNRLGFVFYVLKDSGSVYSVFEVLNSRGLPVDWLDKAKSMLMGKVYYMFPNKTAISYLIPLLHNRWVDIYRIIGLTDIPGHEIIKFTATLLNGDSGNRPMSPEESMEYFAAECKKDRKNIFPLVNEIHKITSALKRLYSNRRLKAVTDISQARLVAVSIFLSNFSEIQKQSLLAQWERVTFRIFGIFRKDSRTSVGNYVRIAKGIYSKELNYNDALHELKQLGKDYPIKEFTKQLTEKDCYKNWSEELRYFIFKYEEYLSEMEHGQINEETWESIWSNSPVKSIEHVFPQNPNGQVYWRGKLGRGKKAIDKNVHRLGNLLLLTPSANPICSNKPFLDKKRIYEAQMLFSLREILAKKEWDLKAIDQREKRLIKWAKITWCDLD